MERTMPSGCEAWRAETAERIILDGDWMNCPGNVSSTRLDNIFLVRQGAACQFATTVTRPAPSTEHGPHKRSKIASSAGDEAYSTGCSPKCRHKAASPIKTDDRRNIGADYTDMSYPATPLEIAARRKDLCSQLAAQLTLVTNGS